MVRLHVKMMRFRRYRVFLAIAAIGTIILIRLSQNQEWNSIPEILDSSRYDGSDTSLDFEPNAGTALKTPVPEPTTVDIEGLAHKEALDDSKKPTPKEDLPPKVVESPQENQPAAKTTDTPPTIPKQVIPDRQPALALAPLQDDEVETQIHMESVGRIETIVDPDIPEIIHWEKQKEHFPVDTLIQLPTGTPLKMPTIQFQFSGESANAKQKREERLAKVKKEFVRAWGGYKEFAWMDDELMPVSGSHRNPFGGWSATLVDSLDTLWIMGLESDFEEAVQAVRTIDFTISKRSDIQMFETTIRYLGGLLGAYDISGGKYQTLLDKAVELAEVLISAFDTPNRMPDLNYRWKPAFASQRHRAGVRSNLAELGSMSLEFTRLAQLTKDAKYYDAVARVTNALEEWQIRGTRVPGVFPETVDASGCNRTVPNLPNQLLEKSEPVGYTPPQPKTAEEPKKPSTNTGGDQLEIKITPGEPGRAQILVVDDTQTTAKRDLGDMGTVNVSMNATLDSINSPREGGDPKPSPTVPVGAPSQEEWDCVAQGLDASGTGSQAFGMGGSQDSTYEYFTKQYLLLGGLETKYKTMYTKSLAAVYKYMLYRPMIPDESDVLFSGKLAAREIVTEDSVKLDIQLEPEITHLTCFLGGMVGMGAKLFGSDTDLEIAKKLTEGCVWAYGSMPSGIMAEYAKVVPCESAQECPWNATLWEEYVDPIASQRDQMVRDYDDRKENMRIQKEAALAAYEENVALSDDNGSIKDNEAEAVAYEEALSNQAAKHNTPRTVTYVEPNAPPSSRSNEVTQNKIGSSPVLEKRAPVDLEPIQKRATNSRAQQGAREKLLNEKLLEEKLAATEEELTIAAAGHENYPQTTGADQIIVPGRLAHDPRRPLTHLEFLEQGITEGNIVRGYVSIPSNNYILRPEAIESVWYMYRITGDPAWQDKGWKMFESIIAATSTPHGHSAINYVTSVTPSHQDKMESFWLAETLKYFYLLFSTPDIVSLDEWVLNTEAHPFKRPS